MDVPPYEFDLSFGGAFSPITYLSQGCKAGSLYDEGNPSASTPNYGSFGVPYGQSLPFVKAAKLIGFINPSLDPYASTHQSTDLREIESTVDPDYTAHNDTLELGADYAITPSLTFTSQTGFINDFLWSTEYYNRLNTTPGIFN